MGRDDYLHTVRLLECSYSDDPVTFAAAVRELRSMLESNTLPPSLRDRVVRRLVVLDGLATLPVPTDGWIGESLELIRETESPLPFWLFTFATLLGSALGRKVWIKFGPRCVYPNLSVLFTGPSGRAKKSTPIAVACGFPGIREVACVREIEQSTAWLLHELSKRPGESFLWVIPEFTAVFHDSSGKEGLWKTVIDLLDCPDGPKEKGTLTGKLFRIENVFLSILAASNLELLRDSLTRNTFAGGFFSRVIPVYQEDSKRPVYWMGDISITAQRRCVERLREIADSFVGEIKLTEKAHKVGKAWYERTWHEIRRTSSVVAMYREREQLQFFKLCIILARSRDMGEITAQIANEAIGILEWVRPMVKQTLLGLLNTEFGRRKDELLVWLNRRGRATPRELFRYAANLLLPREIEDAVKLLVQIGYITFDGNAYALTSDGASYLEGADQ